MTVFRKAVLERKKNNITGVLFDDTDTRKMKGLLLFMLIMVVSLLFISQKTIKAYTTTKIYSPSKELNSNESCFSFEYEKTKERKFGPGELVGLSINKKDHLTGVVIHINDVNLLCVKLTKEKNKEISQIGPGRTIYLWKHEKIWFFLYNKIKGSTGL
ncbi:hypothetical protein ACU611_08415 [Klebsiella aerogenes]|uniref:hypothetical protein n=2 Tax=Gammaproteobacteria TaxID=1236 RepID=UPI00123BCD74|nr:MULTISPECIES: hypothetical protein [Enterobacterales]KAA8672716.1 hypothetical protein F4W08_04710 [Pantoea dispersa]MBT2090693.1 hypothetical protein [Enterobacter bugandensis]